MERPFLVGREIYLRPIETTDAARFVVWLNDPEVTRTLLFYRPVTLAFERDWIERAAASDTDLVLGIALRRDDRLIGGAGLHRIDWRNRNAGFGIHIGEKALWGRGYGTEATRLVTGVAARLRAQRAGDARLREGRLPARRGVARGQLPGRALSRHARHGDSEERVEGRCVGQGTPRRTADPEGFDGHGAGAS